MNAEFRQRMPDELHDRAKKLAKKMGMSLTAFVNLAVHEKTLDLSDLEKRISELEKRFDEKKEE